MKNRIHFENGNRIKNHEIEKKKLGGYAMNKKSCF